MNINFTETAWKDYVYLENQDKETLKRINNLIEDIVRNRHEGIGKPEQLRNDLSGWWSRRIDEKNRLVYRFIGDEAIDSPDISWSTWSAWLLRGSQWPSRQGHRRSQ